MNITEHELKAVLLFSGCVWLAFHLYVENLDFRKLKKVSLLFILLITTLSVFRFHFMVNEAARTSIRYHEVFHYFNGAKYYQELGQNKLYDCSWVALTEVDQVQHNLPKVTTIRNLSDPWAFRKTEEVAQAELEDCHGRFSIDRWEAFKKDVSLFQELKLSDADWQKIFLDFGNNPPPTWNLIAAGVANSPILDVALLKNVYLLDEVILFVIIPLILFRYFGFVAALFYLLIYTNNPLFPASWDGGSFLRHLWLVALVAGMAALHKKHYALAGSFLAASSLFAIFPVVFLTGAALPLLFSYQSNARALIRYASGLIITGSLLVLLSVYYFSVQHWLEFIEIISSRANNFGANTFGYFKHAVDYYASNPGVLIEPRGMEGVYSWFALLRGVYLGDIYLHTAISVLFVLLTVLIAKRCCSCALASLLFGTTVIFFFATPYSYYYVFLALFAPLLLASTAHKGERIKLLYVMGFLVMGNVLPRMLEASNPEIVLIHVSNLTSSAFLVFLFGLLAWYLMDFYQLKFPGKYLSSSLAGWIGIGPRLVSAQGIVGTIPYFLGALVFATFVRDIQSEMGGGHYIEAEDLASKLGYSVQARSMPATANWNLSTLLQVDSDVADGTLKIELPVEEDGNYEIVFYLAKSYDYSAIEIDSVVMKEPVKVDLWSGEKMLTIPAEPLSIGLVHLSRTEPNAVAFKVIGKNKNAIGGAYRFGIDGVSMIRSHP